MRQFDTEHDFVSAAAREWTNDERTQPLVGALVDGLRSAESEVRSADEIHEAGLDLRLGGWVLRTQDMPVLEAIGVVSAAALALAAPGAVVAAAAITAVSGFASLCWKAWRRGAPLSRAEITVLGFLRIHGPMTEQQLVEKVAEGPSGMPADEVRTTVSSLGDVELRDGSIVELVRRDASGRLRVSA
jgi:hypothetical protein